MNIERILCPVDFSDLSRLALHHAASMASWYGAHVDLLHVIAEPLAPGPPRMGLPPAPVTDEVRSEIAAALHDLAAELDLHDSRVSETVAVGAPVARILEHAASVRADLIVLGTHGRTGVQQFLLGSTAERVVSLASSPVLTIPPRANEPPSATQAQFKRILCAVDFSPASLRAFEYGLSLAQENDGRLTLLHVFETLTESEAHSSAHFRVAEYVRTRKRDLRDQLEALVTAEARAWCEAEALVELGPAAPTILRVARDLSADLIVMGAQGHSGLGLKLFGSATQTVVRRAACPVLTARPQES